MELTYNSVTLDQLPGVEADSAELLIFEAAMLFCIAAGYRMSRGFGQEHSCVTLAVSDLIY